MIVEISDTSALVDNETLQVIVNETYTFQIIAEDPNANDVITYTLNGTVPDGATIDNSKHDSLKIRHSIVLFRHVYLIVHTFRPLYV